MSNRRLNKELRAIDSGIINTSTSSISGAGYNRHAVYVKECSGDITGAMFVVQVSPNDSDWYNTSIISPVITSLNKSNAFIVDMPVEYLRVKIIVASTVASQIDIDVYSD